MRFLLFILLAANLNSVSAQNSGDQHLILAGVQGSELRLYTYDLDSQSLIGSRVLAQADGFDNIAWSPEGFILSYVQTLEPHLAFVPTREEMIYYPVPTEPDYADPYVVATSLSEELETSYRSRFSEGGWLPVVIRPAEDRSYRDDNVQGIVLDVYQAYFITEATVLSRPQKVGEIIREYGCGHTASTPMEALLDIESEALLGFIVVTPHGMVFSPGCFGDGLMLHEQESNRYVPLREWLGQPHASPNGEYVAGSTYQDNVDLTLEVVAVADGSLRQYPISAPKVTYLAWSMDGTSLFYAVQIPSGRIDVPDDELSALSSVSGFREDLLTTYSAQLFRLDLTYGESTLLYTDEAYAIGRIEVLTDGSGLIFSQIANGGRSWIDYAITSSYAYSYRDDPVDLVDLTVHYLPLDGSAPLVIADGISQISIYPSGSH